MTDNAAGGATPGENSPASTGPWIDPADRRVGILGGTFDPIHYGHLIIADEVREALQLDRILFIPAAMPPHKLEEQVTQAFDRAAMVELAIAGNPSFSMSPIELERNGPSYTVDTLSDLAGEAARQGVDRAFHFILSVEALGWFKSWHEPARLLKLARLAVVARPGAPMPVRRHLGALLPGGAASMSRVECIETMLIAHSASDVRARVASGRSIRYLVPPPVEAYIRDHRLYLSDNSMRTA